MSFKDSIIRDLKDAAIAYRLALEYDSCPSEFELKDAKRVGNMLDLEITDDHLKEVLQKHQGTRPDEIANAIVRLIDDFELDNP